MLHNINWTMWILDNKIKQAKTKYHPEQKSKYQDILSSISQPYKTYYIESHMITNQTHCWYALDVIWETLVWQLSLEMVKWCYILWNAVQWDEVYGQVGELCGPPPQWSCGSSEWAFDDRPPSEQVQQVWELPWPAEQWHVPP